MGGRAHPFQAVDGQRGRGGELGYGGPGAEAQGTDGGGETTLPAVDGDHEVNLHPGRHEVVLPSLQSDPLAGVRHLDAKAHDEAGEVLGRKRPIRADVVTGQDALDRAGHGHLHVGDDGGFQFGQAVCGGLGQRGLARMRGGVSMRPRCQCQATPL